MEENNQRHNRQSEDSVNTEALYAKMEQTLAAARECAIPQDTHTPPVLRHNQITPRILKYWTLFPYTVPHCSRKCTAYLPQNHNRTDPVPHIKNHRQPPTVKNTSTGRKANPSWNKKIQSNMSPTPITTPAHPYTITSSRENHPPAKRHRQNRRARKSAYFYCCAS